MRVYRPLTGTLHNSFIYEKEKCIIKIKQNGRKYWQIPGDSRLNDFFVLFLT